MRSSQCFALYCIFSLLTPWAEGQFTSSLRQCPQEIRIASSVPRCGGSESIACDPFLYSAAQLAEYHLNVNSSLLDNVTVQVFPVDADISQTVKSIGKTVNGDVHGHLSMTDFVSNRMFPPVITNRVQIPYVSYFPDIVDANNLYYRTVPSNAYIVDALISLCHMFQWYKVGVFTSDEDHYIQRTKLFVDEFNVYLSDEVGSLVHVALEEILDRDLIENNLDHLIERDIKIIVAFVAETDAVDMLCKASQAGLTTSEYAWILPSYTDPDWWRVNSTCTQNELKLALESTLILQPTKYPPFTQTDITYNPEEFKEALLKQTTNLTDRFSRHLIHSNAISAYDGVWTVATAWKSALSGVGCEDSTDPSVTKELERSLNETSKLEFQHLWGQEGCVLDDQKNNSRNYYGQVVITQFQDGRVCPVGIALPTRHIRGSFVRLEDAEDHACPGVVQVAEWIRNFTDMSAGNCTFKFQWRDDDNSAPTSGYSLEYSKIHIAMFSVTCVLVVAMAALLISFGIFNYIHRVNKFIKATSPKVSVWANVGLLLLLPIPVFVGFVASTRSYSLNTTCADIMCWCINWQAWFALTLLYSTLLVKNYRIYRIFHNKRLKIEQVNRLSDHVLLVFILLSLVPVVIVCIISASVDLGTYSETILPLNKDEHSFQFINVSFCSPQLKSFEILVVVYVGALSIITMVFAVFNMNISSQFGAEGKVTTAAILVVLSIGWMDVLIKISFNQLDSPNIFRWEFYWSVVYTFSTVLITSGCLHIPLYYYMYKQHQFDSMPSEKGDTQENSQRLEHYHNLRSEAIHLKEQLDEIEMKLKNEGINPV